MVFKANGVRSWNTNASELEAMVRFYRDVVGANVVQEPEREERRGGVTVTIARLEVGPVSLGLFDWGLCT